LNNLVISSLRWIFLLSLSRNGTLNSFSYHGRFACTFSLLVWCLILNVEVRKSRVSLLWARELLRNIKSRKLRDKFLIGELIKHWCSRVLWVRSLSYWHLSCCRLSVVLRCTEIPTSINGRRLRMWLLQLLLLLIFQGPFLDAVGLWRKYLIDCNDLLFPLVRIVVVGSDQLLDSYSVPSRLHILQKCLTLEEMLNLSNDYLIACFDLESK
jgi:hypothetical protein